MKEKIRVLFICIHNSGRSWMAETFLTAIGGERFEVESAGLEPKPINPYPQKVTGTEDEISENIRSIRDQIREHIKSWVKSL
jgi:protein-tyrosine-phosphatase